MIFNQPRTGTRSGLEHFLIQQIWQGEWTWQWRTVMVRPQALKQFGSGLQFIPNSLSWFRCWWKFYTNRSFPLPGYWVDNIVLVVPFFGSLQWSSEIKSICQILKERVKSWAPVSINCWIFTNALSFMGKFIIRELGTALCKLVCDWTLNWATSEGKNVSK